jgi:hypothetical protein
MLRTTIAILTIPIAASFMLFELIGTVQAQTYIQQAPTYTVTIPADIFRNMCIYADKLYSNEANICVGKQAVLVCQSGVWTPLAGQGPGISGGCDSSSVTK